MLRRSSFWIGLLLIAAYWLAVRPPAPSLGYTADICVPEINRQLMHEEITDKGGPAFTTDSFMTPQGDAVPYMAWSLERDWIGAYVWGWNRDFPFLWVYFGFSLLVSFLGVGWILGRMGLSRISAWAVSLLVVLVHIPRHFKMYFHYEHLIQHWVYLSLFLDAWIWQKFWRNRGWSWNREAWRGVCLLGTFGTAGYFWGALLLEWILVRACILAGIHSRRRQGVATQVEPGSRWLALPVGIALVFVALDLRWFLPLFDAARKLGKISQGLLYFAHLSLLVQPLWLSPLWEALRNGLGLGFLPKIDAPESVETLVTIGWIYWVPFIVALALLRKKRGGPGLRALQPFLIYLGIAVLYACTYKPFIYILHKPIQTLIPFMSYFRVVSRWGLFLPQIVTVCVVLAWPELSAAVRQWYQGLARRKFLAWAFVFLLSSVAEAARLFHPIATMPPLSAPVVSLLDTIRKLPGTTVLDMPFCVAGGNGYCSDLQCPGNPYSTTGACLRQWHDKKVYGLYQARMTERDCEIYDRQPYVTWFQAWREQRCLNHREWQELCGYLQDHPEISSVLVYPEIWTGAEEPGCLERFAGYLGAPLGQGEVALEFWPDARASRKSRVIAFPGRCRESSAH